MRPLIPNLGIGLGLRLVHYWEIVEQLPPIDWFEINSEYFMSLEGQRLEILESIAKHYPLAQHGLSLSIGSSDPLDFDYLKKLKALTRKTKTPWVSDHLSWGKLYGNHYHDLLPLLYTQEVANYVAERARIVQDFLELPLALENVTAYASCAENEMPEWEFYSAVVERADIFMMLDINNLYISSHNLGFEPQDYYKNIPLDRVIQIHLAGFQNRGNYLLDTHDGPVSDPVWKLYEEIYPKIQNASVLLEWDENIPSLQDTWKEVLKAKEFQKSLTVREVV